MKLKKYLTKEFKEGKQEFRLFIQDNGAFYIHPQNEDGETFDGNLYLPDGSQCKRCNREFNSTDIELGSKLRGICTACFTSNA